MKTVAVVTFKSRIRKSPEVLAISNLPANGEYIHFHDPSKYKTAFYTWFVQVKKRCSRGDLKCSKFKVDKNKNRLDGKQGRDKQKLPKDHYAIWSEPSA